MKSVGNYKWMKGCDSDSSRGASKAMKKTGKLLNSIAVSGKTKKAFRGYK